MNMCTDYTEITEIMLKTSLNTIQPNNQLTRIYAISCLNYTYHLRKLTKLPIGYLFSALRMTKRKKKRKTSRKTKGMDD